MIEIIETPEEIAAQRAFRPHLIERAKWLYDAGYTVLASQYKAPRCFKWKEPDREQCLELTLKAINQGRANSLNIRLDGDLAALDMDFRDERLTSAMIEAYHSFFCKSLPVTCKGKKGGKIFFHLEGKDDCLRVRTIGRPVYPADCEFTDAEAMDAAKCELELKTDVSTVYGYNSPGLRYSYIQDTLPIVGTPPQKLPKLDISLIEMVWEQALRIAGFVEKGGELVSPQERHRAIICANVARHLRGPVSSGLDLCKTLWAFLLERNYRFESAVVYRVIEPDSQYARKSDPYKEQVDSVMLQPPMTKSAAIQAFNELFEADRRHLAYLIASHDVGDYSELSQMNVLVLQHFIDTHPEINAKSLRMASMRS